MGSHPRMNVTKQACERSGSKEYVSQVRIQYIPWISKSQRPGWNSQTYTNTDGQTNGQTDGQTDLKGYVSDLGHKNIIKVFRRLHGLEDKKRSGIHIWVFFLIARSVYVNILRVVKILSLHASQRDILLKNINWLSLGLSVPGSILEVRLNNRRLAGMNFKTTTTK